MNLLTIELLVIAILLVLSALLSATEIAYTGLTLAQLKRVNRLRPNALEIWEKTPDLVLATLLLSNNSVNIAVGVISASMAIQFSDTLGWRESYLTVGLGFLSGSAVLLFGEIIPKVWARQYSIPWSLRITPLMGPLVKVVAPFARAATRIANFILIGVRRKKSTSVFLSQRELESILRHATIPTHSKKILQNLIEFSRSTVQDVMIPRADIVAISTDQSLEKSIKTVLVSGYSRIPVYAGSLNNIVGLLYAKDLLVSWRGGELIILEDVLRPLHFVEPTLPLPELLRIFKTGKHHLAVVKRQGANAPVEGLVTLQDALEAIVGDMKEEI